MLIHCGSETKGVLTGSREFGAGFLGLLVWLASATGCLGNGNRCRDTAHWSDEWCAGDSAMSCSDASEVAASEPKVDEVCDPGMCVEWLADGSQRSGCRASKDLCPEGATGLCVGTVPAYCTADRIPIKQEDCALNSPTSDLWGPFCAIYKTDGYAVCAQDSAPCDGGAKCITVGQGDKQTVGTVVCTDGVWNRFVQYTTGTCKVKGVDQCEVGLGWCEGDEAWMCEECADDYRCTSFVRLDTCAPGSCVEFEAPNDFFLSRRSAGCRITADVCQPGLKAACSEDTVVTCTPDGQTIATYSCSTLRLFTNDWVPYPHCVAHPETMGVECVSGI